MADPKRLYGLNALVLNAADGVGEAIARTLVKHGASVIAADTSNSGVVQHYKSVRGITGHVAKLNDPEQLAILVAEIVEKLGGLDILVTDFLLRQPEPLSKADIVFSEELSYHCLQRETLTSLSSASNSQIIAISEQLSHHCVH